MSEILSVLFAIFVGIMVIPKFVDYQQASNDNTRAAATAQQQKQLNEAAAAYIQQNSVAVQATATPTTPAVITVAMLQASGVDLLPASFSATNPYGQTWQVQVLEPTPGNLQALAMSTGGDVLRDAQATKVATIVGAAGGFIPQNDSGIYPGASANAYGAFAGWTVSTSGYTSVAGGRLAALLTFNNGQLQSNYLYRNAVPGQPQLNQMNTPLIMAATQTTGAACTTTGAIAQDGSGAVISCQGGTWKAQGSRYWKDPVANFASLPSSGNNVGDVRLTTDTARAFSWTGSTWSALAVDQSGNLSVPGSITMSNGSTISSPGRLHIEATENLYLKPWAGAGQVIVGGGGGNGQLTTTGRLTTNEYVQVNGVATENTACSPNGLVGRDTNGLILSCQSGVWKRSNPKPVVAASYDFNTCTTACYQGPTAYHDICAQTGFYQHGNANLAQVYQSSVDTATGKKQFTFYSSGTGGGGSGHIYLTCYDFL